MHSFWEIIENKLLDVEKPTRYYSLEELKEPKNKDIKVCLVYPDTSEIGLSNLGISILFNRLLKDKRVYVDIAFSPWFDMEKVLRKEKIPLFSYFNSYALKSFDIIGISLPNELCYTNVLNILDISGLKIDSKKRNKGPIVIAGGTGAYNPDPLADYIDLFVVGDGEDVIIEIIDEYKREKIKEQKIENLSKVDGVFVPGINKSAKKRISKPGENKSLCSMQKKVHSHVSIEIMRGCTIGCRFCQAGYVNRPVREKDAKEAKKEVINSLEETGYSEVSLLSLSTSDYSQIKELSKELSDLIKKENVSLSLPSLRMDSFSIDIAKNASIVKNNTLTFAPEAGSQRLRNSINKNINNNQIEECLIKAFKYGFERIKLYFMIGLPGEEKDDLEGIVNIAKKARDLGREYLIRSKPQIIVNISTFIPKPNTPLQWSRQIKPEESLEKLNMIKDLLRKERGVKVKWHDVLQSSLEGLISRGDKKIGEVIRKAWENGARFDNWTDNFNFEVWNKAIDEYDIKLEDYLHERDINVELPWSKISCLVSEDYLKNEYENYNNSVLRNDCRINCDNCGVCKNDIKNIFSKEFKSKKIIDNPVSNEIWEYDLRVEKQGKAKYIGHLEFVNMLIRTLKRSSLDLVYTQGFNKRPKLSYSNAMPVGKEFNDFYITVRVRNKGISKSEINKLLPSGIKIIGIEIKRKIKASDKKLKFNVK